jgi:hypothetical protein
VTSSLHPAVLHIPLFLKRISASRASESQQSPYLILQTNLLEVGLDDTESPHDYSHKKPTFFILFGKPPERSVGFEVLTAVVMKSSIFRDIMPCSPLKVSRRFEGTRHHHLQGKIIILARNQRERRWQTGSVIPNILVE